MRVTKKPKLVSFIGIDEHTDLERCISLSAPFPIEWGFLYGTNPGSKPRHPSEEFIISASQYLHKNCINQSLHLCGNKARKFQKGLAATWYEVFDRIQINLLDKDYDFEALATMQLVFSKTDFIIQHRTSSTPTHAHTPLFDTSGGRGIVVESYPDFSAVPYMGFAGGINPDNVLAVNDKISNSSYYLDMESGIRTDDWLDLDKCEKVCQQLWP